MYFTNWLESEEFEKLIQEPLTKFNINLKIFCEPNNDGSYNHNEIDGYIFKIANKDNYETPLITITITESLDVDYETMSSPAVLWLLEHILYSLSQHEHCKSYDHDYPGTFEEFAKNNSINLLGGTKKATSILGFSLPGVSEIISKSF